VPPALSKLPIQKLLAVLLFVLLPGYILAQETVVKGKITDANSGDPLPFVNLIYKGTTIGATTDFDGNYIIRTSTPGDSLIVSYIGYKTKKKKISKGGTQIVNFQLEEDVTSLQEVVFLAGENPAFEILRNVVKNKDKNDKRKLSAYEYDTYTKTEIDVDHMTDKFRKRKIVKKVTQVLDSVERIAGEDGKPILPLFISETRSKFYYRDNPQASTENILNSKMTGVGVEDGTFITQLVGTSFQDYNFYQNWLSAMNKDFVSPMADGWRLYYNYDLTDSMYVEDDYCYRLDFYPKSKQELAFTGTMWITKNEWALKQIDATVGKEANLNFIEKIRIQQELDKTEAGAWIPSKNRVLIDVSEVSKFSAGMLAKFYTSNKNFVVNKPYNTKFYERPIVMAEDARIHEEDSFWDSLRHEPLTSTEKNVYKMIDTLQSIPLVRTYTDLIKIAINGFYNMGKIEVGPYLGLLAWNSIEGFRVQAGFKTNMKFSPKWVFAGQGAYGFKDERFKYMASVTNILSKDKWTTISFRVRSDVAKLGVDDESLADNPLFLTATRWGVFRRGFYFDEQKLTFQREFFKGFSQKLAIKRWSFDPTYNFGYLANPSDTNSIHEQFQTTEFITESRFAKDELFLQDDNERVSLGPDKWPIITVRYTHGFKGFLGSNFEYDKLKLTFFKRIKTGPLGTAYVNISSEYVFNKLPYPLLSLHLGNQSPVYSSVTYNLMNYGEFISDHYASIQYRQYLEGFLLNRIPLIQKLNWRLLGTANVIVGGMRKANQNLIANYTTAHEKTLLAGHFIDGKPYIELGYGIENIFRFLRIDFVHRLSYLDHDKARNFGILFSAQFQL
jgi:hypothetical protein